MSKQTKAEQAASKRYREKNREKMRASSIRSYDKNREYYVNQMRTRARDNPLTKMVWHAKHRAKTLGLDFNITPSDLTMPTICPILGIPIISTNPSTIRVGPTPNSPSLDRIVPSKGYVRGNVRVISHRANTLKSNATSSEVKLVYEDLLRIESISDDESLHMCRDC